MVTDPAKRVTDPAVLRELKRQGIDQDYVEFYQDYAPRYVDGRQMKGRSPYAKFYRDLKSDKRIMVVQGLPRVDADGVKVIPQWEQKSQKVSQSKVNVFSAVVKPSGITVTCKNDQPDGRKKNDKVSWKPQLFLDGIEQLCLDPVILATDPQNENYHNNVLEWDYGICKRRLRLIEGRIRERWVFTSNPGGEVRITHNHSGGKLKMGQFQINDDEELVPANVFDEAEYPLEVFASPETFYPDADPESTSVDGVVYLSDADWDTCHDALSGSAAKSDEAYGEIVARYYGDYLIRRAFFLFDSSGLPDDATISAAVLSLYGKSKSGEGTRAINIYSSNPASNTNLVVEDFDTVGSTPYCDTSITHADWSLTGYNDFNLNAAGKAAISKIGISKFGAREVIKDVGDVPPDDNIQTETYFAEQGAGYKPKLVVTYSTGPTEKSSAESGAGSEASSPQAMITKADGGAGAELWGLLAALAATAETGSGAESASKAFSSADTGSGAEALLARLLAASESGDGTEALLSRLLGQGDSGTGADGYSSLLNDLITAVLSADGGAGLEALLSRALGAAENGDGWERLRAKIAKSAGASDMKLPTKMGQAEMPPKE